MEQTAKIYIAGHRGMVGSVLERKLKNEGFNNIITRTSSELDLRNQQAVNDFFEKKNQHTKYLLQQKLVAYMLTILIEQNLFTTI